jgi:hypothetical protein
VSGFAFYIKISGMIIIKNYLHSRLNLRIQLNDEFNVADDSSYGIGSSNGTVYGANGSRYGSQFDNVKSIIKCSYCTIE